MIVIGAVVLVLAQAVSGAVRGFSDDLPEIVTRPATANSAALING